MDYDYISILRNNVEKEANSISSEDYEAFMGFAKDAEEDSFKEKCIENYIKSLASDQGVEVEEVSFINADSMDLFDLAGEE